MESKPAKKILAFMLAAALVFGGVVAAPPQTAFAAMPAQDNTAIGKPYDGVDFDALAANGSGIYYGAYYHLIGNNAGIRIYDDFKTPMLWRVMGEENNEGYLTLMSEYILDEKAFHGTLNVYKTSGILGFLAGDFMQSFTIAEKSQNNMPKISVTTGKYVYGSETRDNSHQDGVDYPDTITDQQVYLLWGTSTKIDVVWLENVFWTAGDEIQSKYALFRNATGADRDANKARYKDDEASTARAWWLRSPTMHSDRPLHVAPNGIVNVFRVNDASGVRPAFKLNPESVIFTSEIVPIGDGDGMRTIDAANDYSYAPEGGVAKKFKLTVVDNSSGNTLNGVPTTAQTVDTGVDYELTGLVPSQTTGYTINYKIVGDDGSGGREIKSYGFVPSSLSTNLSLDTSGLADGNYDVYVWLQKNNDINSNEASAVKHFALDTAAPTISSVTPSGTGADINGDIVITFNESMDTSVGTVSLSGGIGPLSGTWSTATHTNDTFTASYTGLEWNTPYTITIAGFQDAASNAIDPDPDTNHTFTTKAQPDGPDVSPTTLNLDLNGNATGTLTVSLGQSGNRAATAAVAVDSGYTGDISVSPASLNADGAVIVTGLNVVSGAGITVEFSGGNLATPTSIPVTVNVADSTSPNPPTPPNSPPPPPPLSNWNNSTAIAAKIAKHSIVTAMREGGGIRLAAVLKAHTSELYSVPTGVTLQWQYYDEASGKWLDIDGATEPTYTYTGPATRFRLVVKSGNSAFPSAVVDV